MATIVRQTEKWELEQTEQLHGSKKVEGIPGKCLRLLNHESDVALNITSQHNIRFVILWWVIPIGLKVESHLLDDSQTYATKSLL